MASGSTGAVILSQTYLKLEEKAVIDRPYRACDLDCIIELLELADASLSSVLAKISLGQIELGCQI